MSTAIDPSQAPPPEADTPSRDYVMQPGCYFLLTPAVAFQLRDGNWKTLLLQPKSEVWLASGAPLDGSHKQLVEVHWGVKKVMMNAQKLWSRSVRRV